MGNIGEPRRIIDIPKPAEVPAPEMVPGEPVAVPESEPEHAPA